MTDHLADALDAAMARVTGCHDALFATEDDDPAIANDPSSAPFCGCDKCVAREAIDAAYPHLRLHFLHETGPRNDPGPGVGESATAS